MSDGGWANVEFLVDSLQRVIQEERVDIDEAIARLVLRDLMEQQEEEKQTDDCEPSRFIDELPA